jgi:hypothetical protein
MPLDTSPRNWKVAASVEQIVKIVEIGAYKPHLGAAARFSSAPQGHACGMTIARPRISLVSVIYLAIGLFVASDHHYFANVNGLASAVSATVAVLLWPLVVLGANLHIHP